MANKAKDIIKASSGDVWFDGDNLATLSKIEGKATKEIEEHVFVGDGKTYRSVKGYKVEGTITLKKVDDIVFNKVADAMENLEVMDAKIITKESNSKGTHRIALYGVDIAELPLFNLEGQNIVEEEFPFTAESFERLETI